MQLRYQQKVRVVVVLSQDTFNGFFELVVDSLVEKTNGNAIFEVHYFVVLELFDFCRHLAELLHLVVKFR